MTVPVTPGRCAHVHRVLMSERQLHPLLQDLTTETVFNRKFTYSEFSRKVATEFCQAGFHLPNTSHVNVLAAAYAVQNKKPFTRKPNSMRILLMGDASEENVLRYVAYAKRQIKIEEDRISRAAKRIHGWNSKLQSVKNLRK